MYGLGVLKFLDQLHLKELHLHDLLFLVLPDASLLVELAVDVAVHGVDLSFALLVDFEQGEPFLLQDHLVLHFVVLLGLRVDLVAALLKLGFEHFRLLGFLALGEVDGFLDFTLFILTLLLEDVVALAVHLL